MSNAISLTHNKYYSWCRNNLFSSWVNGIITILSVYFIYELSSFFLNWTIFEADFVNNFRGEKITDRTFCSKILNLANMGLAGQLL